MELLKLVPKGNGINPYPILSTSEQGERKKRARTVYQATPQLRGEKGDEGGEKHQSFLILRKG